MNNRVGPFSPARKSRHGLTLIELTVVVGILAILAGLLVPRLAFIRTIANYANEASSIQDTMTNMLEYHATQAVWPDQFDSLLDSGGSTLYGGFAGGSSTTTSGDTYGLDGNLAAVLIPSTLASSSTSSATPLGSLINLLGQPQGGAASTITLMQHDQGNSEPGNSGTILTGPFMAKTGTGPAVAMVGPLGTSANESNNNDTSDPNQPSTWAIWSSVYPNATNFTSATGNTTTVGTISGSTITFADRTEQIVAVGVGPACTAVGKTIVSPPQCYEKDATRYNRTIMLIRVRSDGLQASLAGGLSPDGRTLDQCIGNYRVTAQR
jgi:prepilin-type N-terminal cleavage/methylation domain-containing protein